MTPNDLFTEISGVAEIKALVGTRVYPIVLPQNPEYPAISYTLISTDREGPMQGPGGLAASRVELGCWDRTYSGAKALSEIVRKKYDRFSGTFGSDRLALGWFLIDERDLRFNDIDAFRSDLDFMLWHTELIRN